MEWVVDLYNNYPLLVWLGVASIFLAIEVSTGSGWLLWPAGAAAIVALLTFILPDNLMVELAIFAVLTGVTALFGRRFLPQTIGEGPDINDNLSRLVGKQGRMVGPGRVFIDGKEWAAVSDGADPLPEQPVEVVAAEGAVLRVRAA